MGGNNLPGIVTSRKSSDEYEIIKTEILKVLNDNNIICNVPYSVPGKKDYGDLDVICFYRDDILDFIKRIFVPDVVTPTISNGKLFNVSFNIGKDTIIPTIRNHNDFQIDFIFCYSNMDMYMFYFSYGDLGSILGRISNAYGLKLGESGLFMNYNSVTLVLDYQNTPDKIYFSDNPREICQYFKLDYDSWLKGFDTAEEIFNFAISSEFFSKDIFRTLNIDHRRRLRLRPMYMNFLKYINVDSEQIKNASETHGEVIQNLQPEAISYFNKWDIVNETKRMRLKDRERNEKYNGHIFMKLGYKGKDIGMMKNRFEQYINTQLNLSLNEFIDMNTVEEINKIIEEFIKI